MAARKKKPTTKAKFDEKKANALLNELGGLLVEDENLARHDWAGISMIFELEDGASSLSGYVYDAKGGHEAEAPDDLRVLEVAEKLREVMAKGGLGSWSRALVQLTQPGPEIEMQFDYDGEQWETAHQVRPSSIPAPRAPKKKTKKKK
ncbi:MAG: hypothetical protein ACO1OB_16650 [Archangium sp.]